jgi:hypothetical protein
MNINDYISNADLATLLKWLTGYRHISTVSTGLAVKATSDPDFKTTATMYYLEDGVLKNVGAAATIDASAVAKAPFVAQAADTFCAYAITYGGGAWNIYKGEDATTAALAITSAYWPTIPLTQVVVGYFIMATVAVTYQCGVTNTNASGCTMAAAVELGRDKIFADVA